MTLVLAVLIVAAAIIFVIGVRPKDLPERSTPSPVAHLDERKARIYENLRDLQFEFRLGKLSDADYQTTKLGLQQELAGVLSEIDAITGGAPKSAPKADPRVCPHCNARFEKTLKFCGECGKPMAVETGA